MQRRTGPWYGLRRPRILVVGRVASLALVVATGALFAALPARGAEVTSCTLQRLAEFRILPNASSSPVVSILIDDQPRRMMLDTGGAWGLLSYHIIGNQKRKYIDVPLIVGGSRTIDSFVRVGSVKIGPVDFKGVDFFIDDFGRFSSIDGTIGVDYLGALDVEIDPVKNVVNFFLPNECGDRVVHWAHDDLTEIPFDNENRDKHIKVTLILDGKEIPAIIDTGSSETYLSAHLAEHLFDLTPQSPGAYPLGSNDSKRDQSKRPFRYRFKRLSLGNITFKNPTVIVTPMASQISDLILGMHELHGLHLYFSYGQRKLYVTTARGDLTASGAMGQANSVPHHPDPLDQINARDYLAGASGNLEAQDYDGAISAADRAVQLDPGLAFAYLVRATALKDKGDLGRALGDAAKASEISPDDPALYLTRLKFYREAGRYDLAYKDADKLVQLQPKTAQAFNRRCWYGALASKFEQAVADCDTALAMMPDDAYILDSRGYAHFKASQLDQSLSDFNAALRIDPKEAHSLYGRGLVEQAKGNKEDAEDDFAGARRLKSEVAETFDDF